MKREGEILFYDGKDYSRRVVDDKSLPHPTLGMRRLVLSKTVIPYKPTLYKLSKPLFRFSDMVDCPHSTFIDSKGYVFNYVKTTYYPLKFFEIESYKRIALGYSMKVKGVHCRFYLNNLPRLEIKYAAIICVDKGYLLYGLSETKEKDTRRKL